MSEITNKDIYWLLNLHKSPDGSMIPVKNKSSRWKKVLLISLLVSFVLIFLVILPFILSIRTSVFMIQSQNFSAWPALAAGVLSGLILLLMYVLILLRNALLEYSFSVLGFETLRHTGTADHLHVQIPVTHNE